jgi:hypothetical protein
MTYLLSLLIASVALLVVTFVAAFAVELINPRNEKAGDALIIVGAVLVGTLILTLAAMLALHLTQ